MSKVETRLERKEKLSNWVTKKILKVNILPYIFVTLKPATKTECDNLDKDIKKMKKQINNKIEEIGENSKTTVTVVISDVPGVGACFKCTRPVSKIPISLISQMPNQSNS